LLAREKYMLEKFVISSLFLNSIQSQSQNLLHSINLNSKSNGSGGIT
jgi:hypothetical protein